MQKFSSAGTSVNSTKLPAVYNKINFAAMRVIDYGCGKYTKHLAEYATKQGAINWTGCDKYNQPKSKYLPSDLAICSNVLNVIAENEIVKQIVSDLSQSRYYVVTVYEGNKSGVGKQSKKDCYQRNKKLKEYLQFFPSDAIIYKGCITNNKNIIK